MVAKKVKLLGDGVNLTVGDLGAAAFRDSGMVVFLVGRKTNFHDQRIAIQLGESRESTSFLHARQAGAHLSPSLEASAYGADPHPPL
jgi:hypothetical protein